MSFTPLSIDISPASKGECTDCALLPYLLFSADLLPPLSKGGLGRILYKTLILVSTHSVEKLFLCYSKIAKELTEIAFN
jgi:hypothetical protein